MADVIDKANDLAEMERNAAIRDALRAEWPVYVGRCHNCDEPISEGLFCDKDCADDHAKRNKR